MSAYLEIVVRYDKQVRAFRAHARRLPREDVPNDAEATGVSERSAAANAVEALQRKERDARRTKENAHG